MKEQSLISFLKRLALATALLPVVLISSCDSTRLEECDDDDVSSFLYVSATDFNTEDSYILVIDPVSKIITDSVFVCNGPLSSGGVTSIASIYDGPVIASCSEALYAIDLEAETVEEILPEAADLLTTSDDQLLLVTKDENGARRIGFVDTQSLAVQLVDTLDMMSSIIYPNLVVAHPDEPRIYSFTGSQKLFEYDYSTRVTRVYDSIGTATNIAIDPAGEKIYSMYGTVDIDSGDFNHAYLEDLLGWVALDSAGERAFFTDVPRISPPTPSSGKMRVYETQSFGQLAEIEIRAVYSESNWISQMQIMPGDSVMFVTPQTERLIAIDLNNLTVKGEVAIEDLAGLLPIYLGPAAKGVSH